MSLKDKMTGRVDILWLIFEKISKKLKLKSITGPKKVIFLKFSDK